MNILYTQLKCALKFKSTSYLHQKSANLGIKNTDFLCFIADVAHLIYH